MPNDWMGPDDRKGPDAWRGVPRKSIKLISELTDGACSEADLDDLRQLLASDDRALEYYALWMDVHSRLQHDLVKGEFDSATLFKSSVPQQNKADADKRPGVLSIFSVVSPRSRRGRRFLAASLLTAAASVLAVISLPASLSPVSNRQAARPRAEQLDNADAEQRMAFRWKAVGAVAVLADSADAKWEGPAAPRAGDALETGRLALASGIVQLEFFSGANVVIEGPAVFDLKSPMGLTCESGRLRAHVPNQALGFTVETPSQRVVDLGTEFAVSVSDQRTEVHVIDGEVRLEELATDKAGPAAEDRTLTVGQGLSRSAAGHEEAIAAASSGFIGRQRMRQLSARASVGRQAQWEAFRRATALHPDTLLYYSFQDSADWERVLSPENPSAPAELEGAIVGCQWSTGRWPWKTSLEFKRASDRVRLSIPGEYDSVTFSCWIRIGGFDRWLSSILLTDGHELGEPHWQFTETGQLLLGVKAGVKSSEYLSPSVLQLDDVGRWVHLACVYDGTGGTVKHFLDGQPVCSLPIKTPTPLRFGPAEMGNWMSAGFLDHTVRSLNGRIDELALFKRPLPDAEVLELYEQGRPM